MLIRVGEEKNMQVGLHQHNFQNLNVNREKHVHKLKCLNYLNKKVYIGFIKQEIRR